MTLRADLRPCKPQGSTDLDSVGTMTAHRGALSGYLQFDSGQSAAGGREAGAPFSLEIFSGTNC
eukprot:394126-Pyramimonas_sp.AAC.1